MNKIKITFSVPDMMVIVGVLMMMLSIINYAIFGQDWIGVLMFFIGCFCMLSTLVMTGKDKP